MCLVQDTPAGTYLLLVTELACGGRAAEFDERCIGAVANVEKFGVDRMTITSASGVAKEAEQRRWPGTQCFRSTRPGGYSRESPGSGSA